MELHQADCLDVLDYVEPGTARLVYIDPPYGSRKQDTYYGVGETREEYLQFMKARIESLARCLRPDGSFLLHVDYKNSHRLRLILDEVMGEDAFMNEIIWCYSGPANTKRYFPRKHDVIFWYGKSPVFNQPRVAYAKGLSVGGKTSWAGGAVDKQKYLDRGKALEDWWTDIPALQRREKEKTGYKTQKPVKLLKRLVEALTNPGDLVVDGFMGSGTTGAACNELGREFVGLDTSQEALAIARQRLG